jgi:Ala-tRNA(Pro) deacylase
MPATKLKAFLDSRGIRYVSIQHSMAFTSSEVAESVHVKGRDFAKTVIVKIEGAMAMVVLPANRRLVLHDLREMFATDHVRLATEAEFKGAFPDCDLGAMPPFGNLYGMEVTVDEVLAKDEEIAFNAGSHTEVIRMKYADFARLAKPRVAKISGG